MGIGKGLGRVGRPNESVETYRSRFVSSPLPRNEQNTRCLTVKQVIAAYNSRKSEGRFVQSNSLIYTVRLCGRITAIDQYEGFTNFTLDDGTGSLNGRIWENSHQGKTDLSGGTVDAYYFIVTNLVNDNGAVLLQTLHATKIHDHNSITLHFLTAIHEECELGKWYRQGSRQWESAKQEAKETMNNQFSTELDKEAIVELLSNSAIRDSESGATTNFILSKLHMDDISARNTLQRMLDEGSIYNTLDYDHYKLADDN